MNDWPDSDVEVGSMLAVGPGMGLLQDSIGAARDRDKTTWLTDHGHRIAAIVPADVAERGLAEWDCDHE